MGDGHLYKNGPPTYTSFHPAPPQAWKPLCRRVAWSIFLYSVGGVEICIWRSRNPISEKGERAVRKMSSDEISPAARNFRTKIGVAKKWTQLSRNVSGRSDSFADRKSTSSCVDLCILSSWGARSTGQTVDFRFFSCEKNRAWANFFPFSSAPPPCPALVCSEI